MVSKRSVSALRQISDDLERVRRCAEELDLELAASLIRMAILDIEMVLRHDDDGTLRLDS